MENVRQLFSERDLNILAKVAEHNNGRDWKLVADTMTARTGTKRYPAECFKAFKTQLPAKRKIWTREETQSLIKWRDHYTLHNATRLMQCCASRMPGRNVESCINKLASLRGETKGRFTEHEKTLLKQAVETYGQNWSLIAANVLTGRTGAQIRDHWVTSLDPDIKRDRFSNEENIVLMQHVIEFGEKWAKIAKLIPGRHDTQCRRKWQVLTGRGSSECTIRSNEETLRMLQNQIAGIAITGKRTKPSRKRRHPGIFDVENAPDLPPYEHGAIPPESGANESRLIQRPVQKSLRVLSIRSTPEDIV